MEIINQLKADTLQTLQSLLFKIGEGVINLLYALIILLLGWLITKIILLILGKTLKLLKIDEITETIQKSDVFGKMGLSFKVSNFILLFVKWILLLVFLIIAADVLNWSIISEEISNLLRYIPKLFSALVLFMIGLYVANILRKAVNTMFNSFELAGSIIVSSFVFYFIIILISITALNQAEIDTQIITNNVTVIFGAMLLTFTLAFGLGSKDVIQKLLLAFYSRKNYSVGDKIKVNGMDGEIIAMDNICISIKTNSGKVLMPIKEFTESRVEILNN